MKPRNFPLKKARRQLRAEMPKDQKTEPEDLNPELRLVRTKIPRKGQRNK